MRDFEVVGESNLCTISKVSLVIISGRVGRGQFPCLTPTNLSSKVRQCWLSLCGKWSRPPGVLPAGLLPAIVYFPSVSLTSLSQQVESGGSVVLGQETWQAGTLRRKSKNLDDENEKAPMNQKER
ncbi:hypothetical protein RRG08_055823 [Elysia crispata]|uniref:Uncharacterized protein n=1 Tax=Elysia crispata TaxID=231223 RepID=A0AAE1AWB9_9GAST|nr:hypothetical protein RRG08_055823 [Elysia crispata]